MDKKIKHLPHVKHQLQQLYNEVKNDMNNHSFRSALQKIDTLLKEQYIPADLYVMQLICLEKLNRWDDVEYVAEKLMNDVKIKSDHVYFYYYILSLFNNEQYDYVIELIDRHNKHTNLQKEMKDHLNFIYEESKKIINEKANDLYNKLQVAIFRKEESTQWLLLNKWIKLNVAPAPLIFHMLANKQVHPFIKTAILYTLQDRSVTDDVTIIKHNNELSTNMMNLKRLKSHPIYMKTVAHIEEIEHQDPTLYSFILQLLKRYFDYIYPFLYTINDPKNFAQAAIQIAKAHLFGEKIHRNEENEAIKDYINKIEHANETYFRITFV